MIERTNTSQFELKPEGHYRLTVLGTPLKKSTAKTSYRIWKFHYIKAGFDAEMSIVMFPWNSYDLLLAVGGEDEGGGVVKWDDENVNGQVIECDLIHEKDKNGVLRECLTNIVPVKSNRQPAFQSAEDWSE